MRTLTSTDEQVDQILDAFGAELNLARDVVEAWPPGWIFEVSQFASTALFAREHAKQFIEVEESKAAQRSAAAAGDVIPEPPDLVAAIKAHRVQGRR